jgi:phosphohistidine phosphatase
MKLYVMRHGPAGNHGVTGDDFLRPLTAKGAEQTSRAAKGLKALGVAPGAVLTSPLARALQTAELTAAELTPGKAPEVVDGLASGANPGEILKVVRGREGDLAIVGHDPDFSALISYVLAGETQPFIDFSKGGVVALRFTGQPERGAATLLWYMRRKQLASLAK